MWNEDGSQLGMTSWSHWLLSFQGILSIASLIIIFVVSIALFCDWRKNRVNGSGLATPERK